MMDGGEPLGASTNLFTGDLNQEEVRVKVIGVGGAGNNAVSSLQLDLIESVNLAAVNTDAQALTSSPIDEKLMIGRSVTRGLSAGGEPELGRKAALTDRDRLSLMTQGMDLVFIVAGLGGGTGSGAAPVIAEIAAEQGALVIAFVTLPFTQMEGRHRREHADEAMVELRKYCDAVIPLPNDLLLQELDDDSTVLDAFSKVDGWLSTGIRSICAILFNNGLINLDFSALRKAFTARSGKTLFGLGRAEGEDRYQEALKDLFMCPLLHLPESALCADRLLINIIGGTDLSLNKVNELISVISDRFKSAEHTVIGAVVDERLQNTLEICVIGTTELDVHPGARERRPARALPEPRVIDVPAEQPVEPPAAAVSNVAEVEAVTEEAVAQVTEAEAMVEEGAESVEAEALEEVEAVGEALTTAEEQEVPVAKVSMPKRKDKADLSDLPDDPSSQEEFGFVEDEMRGIFDNTEKNLYDGQDLDVPTYLRRGIKVPL